MSTVLDRFQRWEKERPGAEFLRQPMGTDWKTWTWKEAGQEVRRIAAWLRALKLPDRSNIAILSRNCAHWILADLAIWTAGHVSVPLYPTLTADELRSVLEHAEVPVIFVGKLSDYATQRKGIPETVRRISFPQHGPGDGTLWEDVVRTYPGFSPEKLPGPEDLATLIYTSGTTGRPKGVMISFGAFEYVTPRAMEGFGIRKPGERFFSYLPLSHIAERMLVEMGALYSGSSISFSESLATFAMNVRDVRPTIFLAVPRIWTKFQEKILERMPQRKLARLLGIPLVRNLVRRKIRSGLGLSGARWIFSGAAPLRASLLEWFLALGIEIHEVYAMTENLAYSHINLDRIKPGSGGHRWPDVEVRFSEEGEILVRHPGMMQGYYKDPALTQEVFTPDGFLKTGDVGFQDSEGFLRVTGRAKDQFKTDKGKYVAPAPIELKLCENRNIEQACVVGSRLPQPIALVTLSETGNAADPGTVASSVEQTLAEVNSGLQSFEQLEKVVILRDDWTIENGRMTPTLKVKRNVIEGEYTPKFEEWFSRPGRVIRE